MTTVLDSSSQDIDSVVAAGENNREYLELAKKGGGHKGETKRNAWIELFCMLLHCFLYNITHSVILFYIFKVFKS